MQAELPKVATKYEVNEMKREIKNRIGLLSILLVAGLLMASIGTALGVGEVFQGTPKSIMAEGTMNADGSTQVTIYEDGKVIKSFTLPEGEEYTLQTPGGAIHMGGEPTEEMKEEQAKHETEMDKAIKIAKKDSRVTELIGGTAYEITGGMASGTTDGEIDTVILTLEVEGKYYKVTIDLNNETVKSVEEQTSSRTEGFVSY